MYEFISVILWCYDVHVSNTANLSKEYQHDAFLLSVCQWVSSLSHASQTGLHFMFEKYISLR